MVVVLAQNGQFCLFADTGLIQKFRRAHGFVYNLGSLLELIWSEKNNMLFFEKKIYDKEQKHFPKKKKNYVGSSLYKWTKR